MKPLLMKELRLVVHPSTYALFLLGALVLIPSWMYGAIFIYGILIAFFNGMNAREMRDLQYSFSLPVSRRSMVTARIITMMAIEAAMLLIMAAFIALREPLGINAVALLQGPVGTAANGYLIGFGFALFGIFNCVFYPMYFRDPAKVGVPFVIACVPVSVCIFAIEALPYLPFDGFSALGIPGFDPSGAQIAVIAAGIAVFLGCSALACRLSSATFADYDA